MQKKNQQNKTEFSTKICGIQRRTSLPRSGSVDWEQVALPFGVKRLGSRGRGEGPELNPRTAVYFLCYPVGA